LNSVSNGKASAGKPNSSLTITSSKPAKNAAFSGNNAANKHINDGNKSFVKMNSSSQAFIKKSCAVIQRTSNKKQTRRLVVGYNGQRSSRKWRAI
jgi:hypothetical protein